MGMKLTSAQVADLACKNGYEYGALNALRLVESAGEGYDPKTGKIKIQFEPRWFKRKKTDWQKDTKNVVWQANKVEGQAKEWQAFNSAFASDPNAAMESTSIGLMQVMGFHYKTLGFKTVGEMWDFAKESEANQLELAIRFIKSIPALDKALKEKNWPVVAYYYNGEGYREFNYDTRLDAAYAQSQKAAYKSGRE